MRERWYLEVVRGRWNHLCNESSLINSQSIANLTIHDHFHQALV